MKTEHYGKQAPGEESAPNTAIKKAVKLSELIVETIKLEDLDTGY